MLFGLIIMASQVALAQSLFDGDRGWPRVGELERTGRLIRVDREVKKTSKLGVHSLDHCTVVIAPQSSFKKLIKKRLESLGYTTVENQSDARFEVSAGLYFQLREISDRADQYLFRGIVKQTEGYDRHPRVYEVSVSRSDVNAWLRQDFPKCSDL